MRALAITALCIATPLVTPLAAQAPDTASFITLQGKDTVAIEQYVRAGRSIAGAWIQNQGGVFVHDYALVLRPDGWPAQYVMSLYRSKPRHTFLISVTYGADTATRIMVRDSVATTNRVVAQQSYPLAALSTLGVELALARVRLAGTDSSTIILDRTEALGPSPPLPVKFFGVDSVRVGAALTGRVDRNGRLLALRDGSRETRRVPFLEVAKLVAGFSRADSIARASRVAIELPPAVLHRFVGEYSVTAAAVAIVELAGAKLTIRVGNQPAVQLLAASPTKFFLESTAAVTFEFDVDATGTVTALTLVQGTVRQRAAKMNVHPDFTGTWVMDTTQSNRDGVLPKLTLIVARSGDTLSVRSEGSNARGPFVTTARYGFDGKPWQNVLGGVLTLTTVMSWEGSTLVFASTGEANGQSITTTDRWTLDLAAVHMTRQSTFAANGQTRSEVLVLVRK